MIVYICEKRVRFEDRPRVSSECKRSNSITSFIFHFRFDPIPHLIILTHTFKVT